jgi:hypothetical protein
MNARTLARAANAAIAASVMAGLMPGTVAAQQRSIDERLPAVADGHVRIQNMAGTVKIVGWQRDSVAVTGTVHDTPAERFTVQREDGVVQVGIWDTSVESVRPSHIEVRVPAGSTVWIRTGSASIYAGGVTGSLDAASVGGDIELRGSLVEAFVESMTGTLVLDVRTKSLRAKTVTGAVRLHGVIVDATVTSVSGNILIEGADIQRGSFESVNGELRLVGSIRSDATLGFVTHGGAIEFLLPAATDATFQVATYEGGFVNEFRVPVRTSVSKIKGSEHGLSLGTGRAQVTVRTFRGRVVLRSR